MNSKPKDLTITDIAKACNVGVSTVSRAINNHPSIDPRTKSKILEEIERVGYIPNNSARFLKRTNTKTIAIYSDERRKLSNGKMFQKIINTGFSVFD